MLNNKTILITGGTGSFGNAFVKYLLNNYPNIKEIRIFSRDEQKFHKMSSEIFPKEYPVKYFIGDVRDKERLLEVSKNVDVLVHSAAMKHVPASELNPMEAVKTNILGSQNIIDVSVYHNIPKVVALSTDKAAWPVNVYGATKMLLEKLFVFANSQKLSDTKFSVVRYGNIFGSKGSVVPFFIQKKKEGVLPITDFRMTRFSITLQESIDLVMYAIEKGWGGEIIVPIAPSYKILDVAKAIAPEAKLVEVGKRIGEKLHEVMVAFYESPFTVKRDNYYIICPQQDEWDVSDYCNFHNLHKDEEEFEYSSDKNDTWLSVEDIQKLINEEKIIL